MPNRFAFRARALRGRPASALVLVLAVVFSSASAPVEIRYWVDDAGVTHFTDDPDSAPGVAERIDEAPVEVLDEIWSDGLVGPSPGASEASFGDDRVTRLLRGAMADLERGELARADSTLRGVLRLEPRNASAHWYLAVMARARGRFSTAEHHLALFLDSAGPELEPWRARARAWMDTMADERRLADPDRLEGPLRLEAVPDDHFRVQLDARLGEVAPGYANRVVEFLRAARSLRVERARSRELRSMCSARPSFNQ